MTTVRTEAELQNAILAQEADIRVAADFNITELHSISHTVTISSAQGGPYTLTKAADYYRYLFTTLAGGSLTLRDIILDGARETHTETAGSALIRLPYGTLILDSGSVLQNNDGGGVYANDNNGTPITMIIRGNATIRGNRSDFDGIVDFSASLPESSLQISGQALFEKNEGGGLRYSGPRQNTLTIGGQVKFLENSGMGIEVYYSGLHLMGNVDVSGNQASGIYFSGTRLKVDAGVTIRDNHAGPESNGGGGIYMVEVPEFAIHGLISGNTAGQGGGIYYEAGSGSTIDLSRARFVNNKALNQNYGRGGGFAIYERGSSGMMAITLDDAVFEGNQSVLDGGGMSIEFPGEYGGPGLFALSAAGSQFRNNIAGGNGGGAYFRVLSDSTAAFEACAFVDNQAADGGGLYAGFLGDSRGAVSLENDDFSGNKASGNGGGIYHNSTGKLALSGGTLDDNTAAQNGQGIYNEGLLELGKVVVSQDGLYFQDAGSAPAVISALEEGSSIPLEASDYVAPNPAGTPIVVARASAQYPLLTQADAAAFRAPQTAGFTGWGPRLNDNGTQVVLAPVDYTLQYENTLGAENPNPMSYTVLTPAIALQPLAAADYSFLGWFDAPEGGSQVTEIPLGSTGDRTLYARWRSLLYTLTYYGNDAGGPTAENVPLPQTVREGESTFLSHMRPTRAGYLFTGWNTDPAGGGTAYQPGQTTDPFYADLTIYAQWRQVWHTLTYHGNDEAGPPAQWIPFPQPVPEGQVISLPNVTPTRNGYTFSGWNTRPDGGGTAYRSGDPFGPIFSDADLYAQWIPLPPPVSHTLVYCGNDAGGPPVCSIPCPQQVPDGQCALIPCCAPYRACYCFMNWNTDPCGRGQTLCPGQAIGPVTGDVCLYAQWRQLPPKLCDFCRRE